MKLTKRNIDKLELPDTGKKYYKIIHDDTLRGFALRITSHGTKTFIINRKIRGKVYRMNIGHYGDYTVEQARSRAEVLLGELSDGQDPKKARLASVSGITLKQAFNDYMESRKSLAEKTKQDYESLMNNQLADWQGLLLKEITRNMVVKRHAEIGKTAEARANNAFKILSAVYNFAMYQYADQPDSITDNPVLILTQTRSWYKLVRRGTKISHRQLPAWYEAVNSLRCINYSSIEIPVKYYLILLLFTGLRKEEPASLIWHDMATPDELAKKEVSYISFEDKIIFIHKTKNRQELTLPMSDYICELFKDYRKINKLRYVFPGAGGKSYIKEPKKVVKKIIEQSKVSFMIHDLRRTFATMANEIGIPAYTIKRLINHKTASTDVTAGYIVNDVEFLRGPANQIANYILEKIVENSDKNNLLLKVM